MCKTLKAIVFIAEPSKDNKVDFMCLSAIIFEFKSLKSSITKGGSSIKDFKNSSGESGTFQQFFTVYGKHNENCSRNSCNGKVKKIYITKRSSFYCNKCQK